MGQVAKRENNWNIYVIMGRRKVLLDDKLVDCERLSVDVFSTLSPSSSHKSSSISGRLLSRKLRDDRP